MYSLLSVSSRDLVHALLELPTHIDIGASNVEIGVKNFAHGAADTIREVVHRDLEHLRVIFGKTKNQPVDVLARHLTFKGEARLAVAARGRPLVKSEDSASGIPYDTPSSASGSLFWSFLVRASPFR